MRMNNYQTKIYLSTYKVIKDLDTKQVLFFYRIDSVNDKCEGINFIKKHFRDKGHKIITQTIKMDGNIMNPHSKITFSNIHDREQAIEKLLEIDGLVIGESITQNGKNLDINLHVWDDDSISDKVDDIADRFNGLIFLPDIYEGTI